MTKQWKGKKMARVGDAIMSITKFHICKKTTILPTHMAHHFRSLCSAKIIGTKNTYCTAALRRDFTGTIKNHLCPRFDRTFIEAMTEIRIR